MYFRKQPSSLQKKLATDARDNFPHSSLGKTEFRIDFIKKQTLLFDFKPQPGMGTEFAISTHARDNPCI